MPTVIPVKFAYSVHDLWFDPKESGALAADHVICATERGTEIGLATADPFEVSAAELGDTIGQSSLASVVRVASGADLERADELATKGEEALPVFRSLAKESGLDMKPVGVEYLFGGEKVVCYFAADDRVDFRQLVRDLSHALRQRIDMRQIGVREEAAIVGGYGHCGQELCCCRFGLQFEPVSIRMAKEQDLPLNSNKISGACGRLMCCLRYEFEAYRDFKSRAPKRNAVIDTPLGKAKIIEYDTPKEEICLRIENGKQIRIPLKEMVPSECAKKKSDELGCACRPDTVLRSSLDKLSSPDIQMALAELDREHGVIPPEESFAEDDLFVDKKPRRQRRRSSAQSETGASAGAPSAGGASADEQPGRRRRSHHSADEAAKDAQVAKENKPRRRRRKSASPQDGAKPQKTEGQSQAKDRAQAQGQAAGKTKDGEPRRPRGGGMRRRHHRAAQEPTNETQRQKKPSGETQAAAKHMRHPGDKGGAGRTDVPKQASASTPDGAQTTRRRRHRGGRGRSRAQGGQGALGSNGSGAPGNASGGASGGAHNAGGTNTSEG
ncbi:MAG: regulatory iron-sulfur-containing complex subunit RicT [Atopobiaceae bacterium]|jgi:cell fate regulator YaaT (PSP1 superfamily)